MMKKTVKWNSKPIKKDASVRKLEKRLTAGMTAVKQRRWAKAVKSLDGAFLKEKAEVITESVLEVYRNRRNSPNELLQRNIWGCLDAVALHLDASGFSAAFRDLVPLMLRDVSLIDPVAMDYEYSLVTGMLGYSEKEASKNGLGRKEFDSLMNVAEKFRCGKIGLRAFVKNDFSFLSASTNACGRSTSMLKSHTLPGTIVPKLIPSIIVGVLNLVAIGSVIVAVITLVVLLTIWWFGC
jgi:hypothetical protein